MSKFLDKSQIAALSMKQLENRVFIYDSSPADEKHFRTAFVRWVKAHGDERDWTQFLWDLTFERNDQGKTIKYLYFNERTQKLYLDRLFVEWVDRALDEIEATLEKTKNND